MSHEGAVQCPTNDSPSCVLYHYITLAQHRAITEFLTFPGSISLYAALELNCGLFVTRHRQVLEPPLPIAGRDDQVRSGRRCRRYARDGTDRQTDRQTSRLSE